MIWNLIDLAAEQFATRARSRFREATLQGALDGVKDALAEIELHIDLKAAESLAQPQALPHQQLTLPAAATPPNTGQKRRGRPRKHTNYENTNSQGS